MVYFINCGNAVSVPLDTHLVINKHYFPCFIRINFLFEKLNDIKQIGNDSPSCQLTAQSQQCKQNNIMQQVSLVTVSKAACGRCYVIINRSFSWKFEVPTLSLYGTFRCSI